MCVPRRLLLFAWLLGLPLLTGQAQPARELTPEESVRLGLARNALLRAAQADAVDARAAYRQAQAGRLPSLSSQASYTRLSGNIPEIDVAFPGLDSTFTIAPVELNRYYAEVSVEQPLFTGFRLHNQIRAAGHQAAAADAEAEQAQADVAYDIRRAYWQLYQAVAVHEAAVASLAHMEVHLQDVRNRRDAGAALESDVLTAQARRSETLLDRIEAENTVQVARLELNRLTGQPLDTPVQPVADVAVAPLADDLDTLVARALGRRPQLLALAEQTEAFSARVAATRGNWFPEVALNGRYVYARPNQYFFTEQDRFRGTWEGGVVLRWTLWNGGQRLAETRQAQARLQAAEARLADARDQVAVAVRRQVLAVQRSVEAVAVTAQTVREADEAARVLRRQYEEGAALSADVLDAEGMLRTAHARRAQAVADYETARAALLHALGQVW